MAPSLNVEYRTLGKVKFVAIALPVLGTVGGILKMNGWSDVAMLSVVVPLLIAGFLLSGLTARLVAGRRVELDAEAAVWRERDIRLQRERERIVAEQQKELREMRLRQEAEQAELVRKRGSKEQLAALMNRHRAEYEDLLRRRRLA